jgi:hypothetical protein
MNTRFKRDLLRLVVTGLALCGLAGIAYGTLRLTFGPRPVYVHVRWAESVDEATRLQLENRYGLRLGELREGRTWGYALTNLSHGNIRALVTDSAVEDTHQIHRTAFRVGYFAPRLPYRTAHPWMPVSLEIAVALLLLMGMLAFGLAGLSRGAPGAIRGPILSARNAFVAPREEVTRVMVALLTWIRTRIPDASAEAAGLFRVVFGIALLIIVLRRPVGNGWTAEQTNVLSGAHAVLLRSFREMPWLAAWIPAWVAFWGSMFVAGASTRTSYALTTCGVFAWATLYTTHTTYHTVCALLVALLCLSWSKWGDAWSVDALWRRPTVRRAMPKEYGYTVWMPSLVLGVIFAAAAFAKLRESGVAWILNGTVKYHFLSDSPQAMVDWGLQLGRHPLIAVLLSFAAIAIESLVIVGVLSRLYRYRLIAGVSALCLLAGFSLLQGLFWPGWWILLLSFLPWHLVGVDSVRTDSMEAPRAETGWRRLFEPAAVGVIVVFLAVQLVVSAFRIEVSPLISTYDMYSTTYSSPAEYEQKAADQYWLVATDDRMQLHQCRISRMEADTMAANAASPKAASMATRFVRRCFEPSVHVRTIAVEGSRVSVDWAQWRPGQAARVRLTEPIVIEP